MQYKINIQGMHCQGCKSLLIMLFDEKGFIDINIDLESNTGTFTSDEDKLKVKELLDSAFKEAGEYTYSNLEIVH